MITYIVQGESTSTRNETITWAKKLCAHIKSLDPKNPPRLMVERFGNRQKIYFVQNFDSLSHLETFHDKLANDKKYNTLISSKKLINGTLKDTVLTMLDV